MSPVSYFSPLPFPSFQSFFPGFHSEIKAVKKGWFNVWYKWRAEAKGVNEGIGVSSQGGWLGTCSADLLLDRCSSSICSSSATGFSHFLCFLPCSCSSLSAHQFRIPKERAKNLIGNGHSHHFNFIWAVTWDIVQSQCWWIDGEFPGHLFFTIRFSWF